MRRAVVALALLLVGCSPVAVGTVAPAAPDQEAPPAAPAQPGGAPARVEVTKFETWPGPASQKPERGNVYVSALVRITAAADTDYSPYYAKVRAPDGFEYDWQILPKREPSLGSGSLAAGESVQGWVTFEVPKASAGKLTLIYDSVFADPVKVKLGAP